jgi:hypothetical protein
LLILVHHVQLVEDTDGSVRSILDPGMLAEIVDVARQIWSQCCVDLFSWRIEGDVWPGRGLDVGDVLNTPACESRDTRLLTDDLPEVPFGEPQAVHVWWHRDLRTGGQMLQGCMGVFPNLFARFVPEPDDPFETVFDPGFTLPHEIGHLLRLLVLWRGRHGNRLMYHDLGNGAGTREGILSLEECRDIRSDQVTESGIVFEWPGECLVPVR